MSLPIETALPDLLAALQASGRAVLQAPPGAGKTTRVPLALVEAGFKGKVLMLEPRRLAARAAADRLAQHWGETPGGKVGYRMRGDSKAGSDIEVVTEGILTRMLQSDPELPGIGTVIFDEFHERSLNADLGLALTWEARSALRPDLNLLVMSATLDAAPVAALLDDAPIITSEGRAFPVETRWLPRPLPTPARITANTLPNQVADLVTQAASETQGGILVFLPGAGEIERTKSLLEKRLPNDCILQPLYGALPFAQQRAAIQPLLKGRKVVLATSIAETSLTIEDIRVVVDAGKARRAQFDPSSGMSRLVTQSVSRAEATQRKGRAGRVAEGVCYRLWSKPEEGALQAFPPAEITSSDLTGLALDLAEWGAAPDDLAFLTQPPQKALSEAQSLLTSLGALDQSRITDHGKRLARLSLHPRLAHMLMTAGKNAAPLAALLSDLRGPGPMDLSIRLRDANTAKEAKRLAKMVDHDAGLSLGQQAALAYPDRIGLRRKGDDARYVLSGGKGAAMDNDAPLAGERLIVACDLDGDGREAKLRLGIGLSEADLREIYGNDIAWHGICEWSKRDRKVLARQQEKLGALVLQDRIWKDAPEEDVANAMLIGVRQLGLPLSPAAKRFRARVALVDDLPDLSEDSLMESAEDWLSPYLDGIKSASQWKEFDLLPALRAMLTWDEMQRLDAKAPSHFTTPLGRNIPIDYDGEAPEITLRLQEVFGQMTHPMVGKTPLRVTLLSPGHKPLQTTQDIPGFWASSYADVRRDMRGRYPKHPWPEDPSQADPTLRAKPRKR